MQEIRSAITDTVTVTTRRGAYPVIIGTGLEYGTLCRELKQPCKIIVVSDNTVFPLHGIKLIGSFAESGYHTASYLIQSGEASKTLGTIARLLNFFAKHSIAKSDLVVAFGGGVVTDIAGFAAAIYLRGIDVLHIPTTLLAAVDASVGGKTGVNLAAGKNLAGAFHQPVGVLCDTDLFSTLPPAVFADGMAEVIKHGMIADREMLALLDTLSLAQLCRRNVAIKARVVAEDEFDRGARALLNFGHTVGHAVEKLSSYRVSHGQAVATGMAVMTRAAEKSGLTQAPCADILQNALERCGLPWRCEFSAAALAKAALYDKKRLGQGAGAAITEAIPKRPGHGELHDIPFDQFEQFIAQGLGG